MSGDRPQGATGGWPFDAPTVFVIAPDGGDSLRGHGVLDDGFESHFCPSVPEACDRAAARRPDLLLFHAPGGPDALSDAVGDVARAARLPTLPAVLWSAMTGVEIDRWADSGAEDVLPPDSAPATSAAALRAVLRRMRPAALGERIAAGPVMVDDAGWRIFVEGRDVGPLRPVDFRLIAALVDTPGHYLSSEELRHRVWGRFSRVSDSALRQSVARARALIARECGPTDVIQTVQTFGYRLAV